MHFFSYKKHIIFSLLVFFQCITMCYFFCYKYDLFIDEQWSFNLSNSYYLPFLGNANEFFDKWLSGSFFYNHLTADPENLFSYGSVWYNQSKDVHPPFYYMVLHTFCSLFPSTFNKWIGFIPNIFCFIITQIFLLKSSLILFKNKNNQFIISLIVCSFYGFSVGCLNTVVIIRMYMMLTMFVTIAMFINIKIIKNCIEEHDSIIFKRYCIYICIIYLFGMLTQYLFAVPAFFMSLTTLIVVILYKEKKYIFMYCLSAFSGVVLLFIFFPYAWKHIFGGGYRGKQMLEVLGSAEIFDRFYQLCVLINSNTNLFYFIIISLLSFIIILIYRKLYLKFSFNCHGITFLKETHNLYLKKYKFFSNTDHVIFICLSVSAILSSFILSRVTQIIDDRYIMHIFPIFILCACYLVHLSTNNSRKIKIFIFSLLIILFTNKSIIFLNPDQIKWSQSNYKYSISLLQKNAIDIIIYIGNQKDWWPTAHAMTKFILVNNIYLTTQNNLQNLPHLSKKENFIVVIDRFCNIEFVKNYIISTYKLKNMKPIANDWNGTMFLCEIV